MSDLDLDKLEADFNEWLADTEGERVCGYELGSLAVADLIAAAREDKEHRARSALLDEAQDANAGLVRKLAERDERIAALTAERDALKAERDESKTVCGACGAPWTGQSCGQKDNQYDFPVCYPYRTGDVLHEVVTASHRAHADLVAAAKKAAQALGSSVISWEGDKPTVHKSVMLNADLVNEALANLTTALGGTP